LEPRRQRHLRARQIFRASPRLLSISREDGRLSGDGCKGDGGEYANIFAFGDGQWKQITRFEDQVSKSSSAANPLYVELPRDNAALLLSRKGAPRGKILRLRSMSLLSKAREVVKEGKLTIENFRPAASVFILGVGWWSFELHFSICLRKRRGKFL